MIDKKMIREVEAVSEQNAIDQERKMSKVAVCPVCDTFPLACHIDYLRPETEKEFTDFSNEGYIIKIETARETRARKMDWCDCKRL